MFVTDLYAQFSKFLKIQREKSFHNQAFESPKRKPLGSQLLFDRQIPQAYWVTCWAPLAQYE